MLWCFMKGKMNDSSFRWKRLFFVSLLYLRWTVACFNLIYGCGSSIKYSCWVKTDFLFLHPPPLLYPSPPRFYTLGLWRQDIWREWVSENRIGIRSHVNVEVIRRPVKGYIMSCRDVLSESRFGKRNSLVKIKSSGEEGEQKKEWVTAIYGWGSVWKYSCWNELG